MARDIKINIGARDNASGVLSRVTGSVKNFGMAAARMGTAFVASAVAVGVAVKKMVDDFAAAGDLIHKTSLRTKLSAEFLSELGFAAEQSGTSLDQMSQAIFRAFRRIGNAETLTGPAARAMKEMGLNAKELAQLEPEQMFFALVDAINSVEDPLRRSQMGFEVFGDNWRQIAPLLEAGSDEIRKLMKEGKSLGVTMTGEMAQSAADYSDAMNRLTTSIKGLRNALAVELAPALTDIADQLTFFATHLSEILGVAKLQVLDLRIAFHELARSIQDAVPGFMVRDDAIEHQKGIIADLYKQRGQIIADMMRGVIPDFGGGAGGGGIKFGPGEDPDKYGGRGMDRVFNKMGQEIGKHFQAGIAPVLQATEGRLLTRGPGADQAAQQGKQILDRMKRFEELMAGGGPGGGIPVREIRPPGAQNVFEMEKVV